MAKCDTCGNDYTPSMRIILRGEEHDFDCFECAIQSLAPACDHCGVKIIGHGVESGSGVFCCDHCLRKQSDAEAA